MKKEPALFEIRPAHPVELSCATVSPYDYAEFAGPGGEHYLKKLLRLILPAALYRTWEIFVEHQARGNDCYLSVPQLATFAGRSLRTMQKDLAQFLAKHLLVERAVRKTFRQADGSSTTRIVVVKDFTALYALAHEYHEWLHNAEYIPAERAFVPLLSEGPALVAKLRRFNNYRRVLYTHQPGPARAREEDRWFTGYQPETSGTDGRVPTGQNHHMPCLSKKSADNQPKELSKDSPKRNNELSHREDRKEDSSDSAPSFSEAPRKRKGESSYPPQQQLSSRAVGDKQECRSRTVLQSPATQDKHAWLEQEPGRSHAPSIREREETSQTGQAAMMLASHLQPHQQRREQAHSCSAESPWSPDHPLARSFLNEIAAPFGDRNPKGSVTRVLNMLANASLGEAEVLLCLVRAYTIARDTRTIRSAHSEPGAGRANRMPLFCTLFERFVQARLHNDKWNYSWQQLKDDLAADDRLLLWWTEHQVLLAQNPLSPFGSQGAPVPSIPDEQREREEDQPRVVGWARREAAHVWGEQLLEALITAGYEAEVRVHLEGPWYQLVLAGEGCEYVLDTPQQVQYVIDQVSSEKAREN